MARTAKPRIPLPARITATLGLVLIVGAWNVLRIWSSVASAAVIRKYAPWPGPGYIAATGAIWAAACLVVLLAFWQRRVWAPRALLWGALGYAAWGWLDRLMLQPQPGVNWPFSLLVTALGLAFIAVVALDRRNRLYLGREAHERQRKQQNRQTA